LRWAIRLILQATQVVDEVLRFSWRTDVSQQQAIHRF